MKEQREPKRGPAVPYTNNGYNIGPSTINKYVTISLHC